MFESKNTKTKIYLKIKKKHFLPPFAKDLWMVHLLTTVSQLSCPWFVIVVTEIVNPFFFPLKQLPLANNNKVIAIHLLWLMFWFLFLWTDILRRSLKERELFKNKIWPVFNRGNKCFALVSWFWGMAVGLMTGWHNTPIWRMVHW